LSVLTVVLGVLLVEPALCQSTQQEFPTPIVDPEVSATIKPRDVGDARLTTHWYLLETGQGDLFLNISARNLNADLDIFTFGTLTPVTKVVVYADVGEYETGRVLYFRKPEKLLLRIQGRTPGDEPASYRLKFAGGFVASKARIDQPELPRATVDTESGVRVNSVGTIIPAPKKMEPAREVDETAKRTDEVAAKPDPTDVRKPEPEPSKPEVITTDETAADPSTAEPLARRSSTAANRRRSSTVRPAKTPGANTAPTEAPKTSTTRARRPSPRPKVAEPPPVDPLANVRLVILFKDGTRIERPLPEVSRFTVDRGVLTVINKDGTIGRYSMVDVAKVTIE
jgi:hypothetical protein